MNFSSISSRKYWLWRALDAHGDVLDILVKPQRNAKAARRFLTRLIARSGEPRVVITDKLRSYFRPIRDLASDADAFNLWNGYAFEMTS